MPDAAQCGHRAKRAMDTSNVYIVCGIPGSGKSTWLKNHVANDPNAVIVSRDAIRFSLLKEDEDYFAHEDEVVRIFTETIQAAVAAGRTVYVDATHLTWNARKKVVDAVGAPNVRIGALCITAPLHICLERNSRRNGRARVPDDVISRMSQMFTNPETDPFQYSEVAFIDTTKTEHDLKEGA